MLVKNYEYRNGCFSISALAPVLEINVTEKPILSQAANLAQIIII
jgi:hypothetical protein